MEARYIGLSIYTIGVGNDQASLSLPKLADVGVLRIYEATTFDGFKKSTDLLIMISIIMMPLYTKVKYSNP
jgi:hypothetical protein